MQNLENLISQCGVQLYDVEVANENGRAIYRIYIRKARRRKFRRLRKGLAPTLADI